MAKRVLCEMVTEEFTGIVYPIAYNGNCYYTDDSAGLKEFKAEVLAEHPELTGKLKIVTVKTMEKKATEVREAREHNRAYQEWKAYNVSRW